MTRDAIPEHEDAGGRLLLPTRRLVLLLAVRPALKMLRGKGGKPNEKNDPATAQLLPPDGEVDREGLDAQIQLAQRIAHEQPQDAVMALRRMLAEPMPEGAAR